MDTNIIAYIIIFLIIVIAFFLFIYESKTDVIAQQCGLSFSVLSKYNDSDAAAAIFCEVHKRLLKLIDHLAQKYGEKDERVRLLRQNYQHSDLVETMGSTETINKTANSFDKIYIKLRKNDGEFYKFDVIMFVAIHEITHVSIPGFKDSAHGSDFWRANGQMLRDASDAGIIVITDYERWPAEYDGMVIKKNPAFTG